MSFSGQHFIFGEYQFELRLDTRSMDLKSKQAEQDDGDRDDNEEEDEDEDEDEGDGDGDGEESWTPVFWRHFFFIKASEVDRTRNKRYG